MSPLQKLDLDGIVVIAGNYGSGKTEVAVNLAAHHRRAGRRVRIADLDLVNPYFRTREARGVLRQLGVEVVLPAERYLHADLPILSPAVSAMIQRADGLTLLDAGGNDAGATVLAALADALRGRPVRMLQVVNPFRPFTEDAAGVERIRRSIEDASGLPVSGVVANPNLIDETRAEDVYAGTARVRESCRSAGLPLEFVAVRDTLLPGLDRGRFDCPLLVIRRQLVPPWKRPASFAGRGPD